GRAIRVLRRQLSAVDRSLRRLASMLGQLNGRIERRRKPRGGARRALSPKGRASLVLQGRYMRVIRQLKPRQKAQVRKVKEEKGGRAALERTRRLAASEQHLRQLPLR